MDRNDRRQRSLCAGDFLGYGFIARAIDRSRLRYGKLNSFLAVLCKRQNTSSFQFGPSIYLQNHLVVGLNLDGSTPSLGIWKEVFQNITANFLSRGFLVGLRDPSKTHLQHRMI